eukprot:GHVP01031277.1.p1 GENE.GHVP01031277.1~~GHVP01031277.1.p1  ORF type:complete len:209 (+),score=32.67 GHVP01031277.1:121-747(+)
MVFSERRRYFLTIYAGNFLSNKEDQTLSESRSREFVVKGRSSIGDIVKKAKDLFNLNDKDEYYLTDLNMKKIQNSEILWSVAYGLENKERRRFCVGVGIMKTKVEFEFLLCRRPRKGSDASFVFQVEHFFAGKTTRTVVQLYREMGIEDAIECIKRRLGIDQSFSMLMHRVFIKAKDITYELSDLSKMFSQARKDPDKIILVKTSVIV